MKLLIEHVACSLRKLHTHKTEKWVTVHRGRYEPETHKGSSLSPDGLVLHGPSLEQPSRSRAVPPRPATGGIIRRQSLGSLKSIGTGLQASLPDK